MESMRSVFNLPEEYIPLDSFEGEGGFFYNRQTGEVLELTTWKGLQRLSAGKIKATMAQFQHFS